MTTTRPRASSANFFRPDLSGRIQKRKAEAQTVVSSVKDSLTLKRNKKKRRNPVFFVCPPMPFVFWMTFLRVTKNSENKRNQMKRTLPKIACFRKMTFNNYSPKAKWIFNNYCSSPNELWVNSPWGRRPNGLSFYTSCSDISQKLPPKFSKVA